MWVGAHYETALRTLGDRQKILFDQITKLRECTPAATGELAERVTTIERLVLRLQIRMEQIVVALKSAADKV